MWSETHIIWVSAVKKIGILPEAYIFLLMAQGKNNEVSRESFLLYDEIFQKQTQNIVETNNTSVPNIPSVPTSYVQNTLLFQLTSPHSDFQVFTGD